MLLGVLAAGSSYAHSGGLNAEGCHNNRKTGEYHCHRGAKRAQPVVPPRAPGGTGDGQRSCGAKTYCTEMVSCQEAIFYFNQCGLTRLDGDGDGVPCEKLCR